MKPAVDTIDRVAAHYSLPSRRVTAEVMLLFAACYMPEGWAVVDDEGVVTVAVPE